MPSWRARIMPVVTSPLRRPSRTSSRCRCRVAVPQPSGRRPAEMVISFAQRSGCRAANTHADHAAEAGADPRHRHRAAAAIEPCGDEVGEAGHRNGFVRMRIVEALPGRSVAGPRRAEHGVLGGIDQIRRAQRRPPRRPRIVAFGLAVAERKRRRGDAADDQDDRAPCRARGRRPSRQAAHPRASRPSIVIDRCSMTSRRGRRSVAATVAIAALYDASPCATPPSTRRPPPSHPAARSGQSLSCRRHPGIRLRHGGQTPAPSVNRSPAQRRGVRSAVSAGEELGPLGR